MPISQIPSFLPQGEEKLKTVLKATIEMAQWLRVLVTLVEDPSLVPSTHMAAHNHL